MKIARILLIPLLLGVIWGAAPLRAQARFELGFGWALVSPDFSAFYLNSFSPPFTLGEYTSSATQTLHILGKTSFGLSGFLNVFLGQRFGLQLLADYSRPKLGGTNSSYDLTLDYTTTQPVAVERTDNAWPATSGDFRLWTFSLNALIRFPLSDNLAMSFSGGPTSFYLEGKAGYIGFSRFWLDEANTLFIRTLKMAYDFGPKTTFGVNLGGEVSYTFMRNIILAVDIRRFQSAKASFPMHLVADPAVTDESFSEIERLINLGSLRINPSYFRVNIVIRFVF